MNHKNVETQHKMIQSNSGISSIVIMGTTGAFEMLAQYHISEDSTGSYCFTDFALTRFGIHDAWSCLSSVGG
jgi:hypothetical protein